MSRSLRRERRIVLYADGLEHGVYSGSPPGGRAAPEVREIGETHRVPDPVGVYAVFGGHGGSTASELCARNFAPTLLEDDVFAVDPLQSMANAVSAMEAFICAKSKIDRVYYGTTLLLVVVRHGRLYVANVGDSRAVLAVESSVVRLSTDHSVASKSELARCRNAGAFFVDGRLNGLTNYTRSLGDLHFKQRKHIFFPNKVPASPDPILSPEPHLSSHVLSTDSRFVVLATHPIWAHLSDAAACALVRSALAKNETPHICARRVASAARAAGAQGPLSVVVVMLGDVGAKTAKTLATRPRNMRRLSAPSHNTASPVQPTSPSAPPPPPLPESTDREVRRSDDPPSPTTPPPINARAAYSIEDVITEVDSPSSSSIHASASSPTRKPRQRSLYRESGRGRRARVLVPVASWGVAPGPNEPLEEASIARPRPSPLLPVSPRSPSAGSPRKSRPQSTRPRSTPAPRLLAPRARTDLGVSNLQDRAVMHRKDSFGVPTTLYDARPTAAARARSVLAEASESAADAVASSAAARVSRVTAASSGKTQHTVSSIEALEEEQPRVEPPLALGGADFGRAGPAKVRYREHDLFSFLRRRKGPVSRHG